jgi:hypothetical protein
MVKANPARSRSRFITRSMARDLKVPPVRQVVRARLVRLAQWDRWVPLVRKVRPVRRARSVQSALLAPQALLVRQVP